MHGGPGGILVTMSLLDCSRPLDHTSFVVVTVTVTALLLGCTEDTMLLWFGEAFNDEIRSAISVSLPDTKMYLNMTLLRGEFAPSTNGNVDAFAGRLGWQTAVIQLAVAFIIWFASRIPVIAHYVYVLFTIPSDWPLHAYPIVHTYLKTHSYLVICVSSIIFFGPISLALPLVVLQDLCVCILFNFLRFFHGFIPISRLTRYYYSNTNAMEFAPECFKFQPIFAGLERMAATYNAWTTKYMLLLFIRVLALILAIYLAVMKMVYWGW